MLLAFLVQQKKNPESQKCKTKVFFQFVHYVQIFIKNIIIPLHVERDVELGIGLLLIFPEYSLLSLFFFIKQIDTDAHTTDT